MGLVFGALAVMFLRRWHAGLRAGRRRDTPARELYARRLRNGAQD